MNRLRGVIVFSRRTPSRVEDRVGSFGNGLVRHAPAHRLEEAGTTIREDQMSEKKTLGMGDIITERKMSRRSTMGVIGAGAALGAAATVVGAAQAQAQAKPEELCSDRDPGDRPNYARCRGISDSDPRDPGGCGRRSCSDSDPSDPAGWGCHC
jgi:hypothetical protein